MKKRPKKPRSLWDLIRPVNASEGECLLECVRRLWTDDKGRCHLPKVMLQLPRTQQEFDRLYAAIGRKKAPQEPEFSRGSGAKLGGKHKDRKAETDLTQASKHKRTQRANKEMWDRTIFINGEALVLEEGVDVDMVKSALASIERRKK
jgi:hypothetical protein